MFSFFSEVHRGQDSRIGAVTLRGYG